MSRFKGRMLYVPPVVLTEIEDIMREDKLPNRADAFKEMTKYTRVGREARRLMLLDFTKAKRLPGIETFYKKKKRRRMGWL